MQILSINPYNYINPTFESRGKPIDLNYIIKNRSNLLPPRILSAANEALRKNSTELPSLKSIHMEKYGPLLAYKSLAELKQDKLYPEFESILETVNFTRDSVYKRQFEEKTKGMDFPLKMLQELWVNLKTKDEVARELGLAGRSSIDWALRQIGFVYFSPNYRILIKASDEVGNREIAQKTQAYNAAHPDEMYARNRHAAQGCKTPEYRSAQRERMLEHDRLHPERRAKISEFDRRTWELCPEIKEALSVFTANESVYIRQTVRKVIRGVSLTDIEARARKGFFKRFWDAHPYLKDILSAAKVQVRREMGKE